MRAPNASGNARARARARSAARTGSEIDRGTFATGEGDARSMFDSKVFVIVVAVVVSRG